MERRKEDEGGEKRWGRGGRGDEEEKGRNRLKEEEVEA
jgi:hypothetical protein